MNGMGGGRAALAGVRFASASPPVIGTRQPVAGLKLGSKRFSGRAGGIDPVRVARHLRVDQAMLMRTRSSLACLAIAILGAACHSDRTTAPVVASGPTCGSSAVLRLDANQSATLACTSGTFVDLAGGAKYLIVPQFASGGLSSGISDTPVAYTIGVSSSALASIVTGVGAQPNTASTRVPSLQAQLDSALRSRAIRALASPTLRVLGPGRDLRMSSAVVVPDSGSLRTFNVLTGGLQSFSTTLATARLEFVGQNMLLYVDTLAPANGFSPAQLQAFGQYFDQTLYSIDIAAFGAPTDIDANGRIIMLLSPSVNSLTTAAQCKSQGFVAGYFDGTDFTSSPSSNHGEVFYSVVPDPNGTVSCAHTVASLLGAVPATFLHELQHLISFSQHVVVQRGQPEEGWLDEGMSIRAEELGSEYFEAKFPPPTGRTSPSQLFPDSSQGFLSGVLNDSYDYLLKPDTASVTLHTDADNGFSWRGGDWLLVHWLGDLKGKAIFSRLEHGSATGIANIESAAGEPFGALFGDFSLALWTDSIVGVPRSAIPARDRFQTRNLRVIYQRVFDTSGGSLPRAYPLLPTTLSTSAPVVAAMVPGTPVYYILDLREQSTTTPIQFAAPGGAQFPAALKPQVSVYRLPN
jgi:hypothetical protein